MAGQLQSEEILEPDLFSFLGSYNEICEDAPFKRRICERCRRPSKVCLCSSYPSEPISIHTTIIVLQHPFEESRCLSTVFLLKECLPEDKCIIIKGKKFGPGSFKKCKKDILTSEDTYLLYPSKDALDMESISSTLPVRDRLNTVIVIDGTWSQARSMYAQSQCLHLLKKIKVNSDAKSEYVIRMQPTKDSLSTLEAVAFTLAHFESSLIIKETLLKPLRLLCSYQLEHGCAIHHSKDDEDYVRRENWKERSNL